MKKLMALALALMMMLGTVAFADSSYSDIDGTIYWIGKMYEGQGWTTITDAAKLAAKDLGIDVVVTYPEKGEIDVQGQINLVENAINAGAAAICLSPNDSSALVTAAQAVHEAGIPLIVFDTALTDTSYQEVFVSYDFYQQGCNVANALGERLGEEGGTVAIISGVAGSLATEGRENGFIDTIKANYPQIEIIGDPMYCNNDSVDAMNKVMDLMTANPDLTAIYSSNSKADEGVGPAIEALGLGDQVTVVACDTSEAIVQFVRDGIIDYTCTAFTAPVGYLSVLLAAKILKGEELGDIEWYGQTFKLDKETMTYNSALVGIDKDVVADESLSYIYYPLSLFDTYEGWDW